MSERQTITTAELKALYDEMDENAHQGHDFENWKAIYCGRYGLRELKPEIAIVVENGAVIGIATTGKSMIVRVIDLDNKRVGDYTPDGENVNLEQYTKDMMED